jgi:hypothetical protein
MQILPSIAVMHTLTILSFDSTIADVDLEYLKDLKRLKILYLSKTEVTGPGLARFLAKSPYIDNVQFSNGKDLSLFLGHGNCRQNGLFNASWN